MARGEERCIVDLVIDPTPRADPGEHRLGSIRVDTPREIAANKLCAVLGRAEIRDLVDLMFLLRSGLGLREALADAERKDAGVDPATLAWVLDQILISPTARLPGEVAAAELDAFRIELVRRLRAFALERAQQR